MFEHLNQYIPENSTFYKTLMQYNSFLHKHTTQHNLPEITNLIGQGAMGYAFNTTDPNVVLKITGLKHPQDSYEFILFDYSHKHPHPALCPIIATLKVGDFYFMWKRKLLHAATTNEEYPHLLALHKYYGTDLEELVEAANILYGFGYLIKFKTNHFQHEIDQLSLQNKTYLHRQARKMACKLKSKQHFAHISELLICLLKEKLLIQDLTSSNLGINMIDNKPVLCILDGMLLNL